MIRGDDQARFASKLPVATPIECWIWQGSCMRGGYGQFPMGDTAVLAHRFAYEMFRGPIPHGLTIDHLCRNRACVNPWHLDPVTFQENIRRRVVVRPTFCKRGHSLAGAYLHSGRRHCRPCAILRQRERRAGRR